MVSLGTILDCPRTHSVDQAGLKLRDPPISASQVLGLKRLHHHTHPALLNVLITSDTLYISNISYRLWNENSSDSIEYT